MATPDVSGAPEVTIAIVTRDRKDELRRAIMSSLEQEGSIEVLVIDDGSRDGTAEMVRDEFPGVRVVRYEDDADVAVRRNNAAEQARGRVIVSIDDDAVFSSPRTVADTLRDLDHPRLGAVAMPYIDVGVDPAVQQQAPEPGERWVTSIFRATAYAIRRDVLLEVGGYTPEVYQYGEEWDLALKLLDAGYLIRLGRAAPINHHTSPKRSYRRMDVFGRRHEMLICWLYYPFPWSYVHMAGYAVKGLALGFRLGRPGNMVVGIAAGLRACFAARGRRRPLSAQAFAFDRRTRSLARTATGVRLSDAEAQLPPVGPPPKARAGGWPAPVRFLHAPLRRLRTRLLAALGRPIHCERCGVELFRGVALVWRGRVILLGAEAAHVRVDWDRMNRLSFRHVDQDHCRPR